MFNAVLRHVPTRWLSLFKCLERILEGWTAVKMYFLKLGEEECPKVIWDFLSNQEDEISDDLGSNITVQECYLYFSHHFLNLFVSPLLTLEKQNVLCFELHDLMIKLLTQLERRKEDKFFGCKVQNAMLNFSTYEKKKLEEDFLGVYTRAIKYLKDWYNFENPPFEKFKMFNLKSGIKYAEVAELGKTVLNCIDIDYDSLYDEIVNFNDIILPNLTIQDNNVDKIWADIFQKAQLPNLFKIVQPVLSISVSNANVERVFSLMNAGWTDTRNRMTRELVEAELCVKINYNMSCHEFYKYIRTKKDNQKSTKFFKILIT
jgi:hypothetical protein